MDCCSTESCNADGAATGDCAQRVVELKPVTGKHLPGADSHGAKIIPLTLYVVNREYAGDHTADPHGVAPPHDGGPPTVDTPLFIRHCTYRI